MAQKVKRVQKAHHLSAQGKASIAAANKRAAAKRKKLGIKEHRKPMTAAQHTHFIAAQHAAAMIRKRLGIRRKPLSAIGRQHLIAALKLAAAKRKLLPHTHRTRLRYGIRQIRHTRRRRKPRLH